MKTVFMGTPEFSAIVLKYLCDAGFVPSAAVTTPDKPAGRGYGLKESSVKRFATDRNIPVLQPERLSDEVFLKDLRNIEPDIIIQSMTRLLLPLLQNLMIDREQKSSMRQRSSFSVTRWWCRFSLTPIPMWYQASFPSFLRTTGAIRYSPRRS